MTAVWASGKELCLASGVCSEGGKEDRFTRDPFFGNDVTGMTGKDNVSL
jgi:hypothetical protein